MVPLNTPWSTGNTSELINIIFFKVNCCDFYSNFWRWLEQHWRFLTYCLLLCASLMMIRSGDIWYQQLFSLVVCLLWFKLHLAPGKALIYCELPYCTPIYFSRLPIILGASATFITPIIALLTSSKFQPCMWFLWFLQHDTRRNYKNLDAKNYRSPRSNYCIVFVSSYCRRNR